MPHPHSTIQVGPSLDPSNHLSTISRSNPSFTSIKVTTFMFLIERRGGWLEKHPPAHHYDKHLRINAINVVGGLYILYTE